MTSVYVGQAERSLQPASRALAGADPDPGSFPDHRDALATDRIGGTPARAA